MKVAFTEAYMEASVGTYLEIDFTQASAKDSVEDSMKITSTEASMEVAAVEASKELLWK